MTRSGPEASRSWLKSALFGYGMAGFLGFVGALAVMAALANEAKATHDCAGGTDNRVISSPLTNGRGVRVGLNAPGMFVENTSVPCARASTLSVVNSAETRAVEIGWYEETVNVTSCPSASSPRVLVLKIFDGVVTCSQNQPFITGTPRNDDFFVHDNNQDGTWNYVRNGSPLGFFGLGTFVTGDPRAQGERKSSHEVGFANFRGLARMGANQTWTNWDTTIGIFDSDEGYYGCIPTNIHVKVLANGTPCS